MATQNISIQADLTLNNSQANKAVNDTRKRVDDLKKAAASTSIGGSYAASRAKATTDDNAEYRVARGARGTGAEGRDFARQAQGLGGLVHVYATFAANLFAVTAAFGALSKAADYTNLTKGLDQLGAASGKNLGYMAERVKEVTDGAVSLKEAMQSVAQASSAGMSGEQIERLTVVAKKASQALGRDMTDSLSRLTRGITKVEPELLDELGIFVRVDKAAADYARTIGKTATALTDYERRQAYAIAALKQAEDKFNAVNLGANPYSKLQASFIDMLHIGGELINTVLSPLVKLLAESPTTLAVVMAGIGGSLLKQAIPALGQWRKNLTEAAEESELKAKQIAENLTGFKVGKELEKSFKVKEESNTYRAQAADMVESNKLFGKTSKTMYDLKDNTADLGRATSETQKKINALTSSIEKEEKALKNLNITDQTAKTIAEEKIAQLKIQQGEYIKLAATIDLAKQKAHEAEQLGSAVESSSPSWEEKARQNIADRAARNAAARRITANVVSNTENYGMVHAWQQLGEEIDKSEVKLNKFRSGWLKFTGAIRIGMTTLMTLVSGFMNWIIVLGLLVSAFQVLDNWLTNNKKQQKDFSDSLDRIHSASDNVGKTLDNISRKPMLEQINIDSILAKANALQELSSATNSLYINFEKVQKSQSLWSNLIDVMSNAWGGSNSQKIQKEIKSSISDAIDSLPVGELGDKYKYQLTGILGLTDVSKLTKEYINKTTFNAEVLKELVTWLNNTGVQTSRTANNIKGALDTLAEAAKNYDTLVNSLAPSDNLSKYAFNSAKGFSELAKTIATSADAMTVLIELTNDINKLKLLPGTVAESLLNIDKDSGRAQLEEAKQLLENKIKAEKSALTAKMKGPDSDKQRLDAEWRQAQAERKLAEESVNKQAEAFKNGSKDIYTAINSAMVEGTKDAISKLQTGLTIAYEKASLAFKSSILSGLDNPTAIKEQGEIKKKELDLGLRQLQSNFDLIVSQEKLRLTFERIDLEKKAKEDPSNIGIKTLLGQVKEAETYMSGLTSKVNLKELTVKAESLPSLLNILNARQGLSQQEASISSQKRGVDLDTQLKVQSKKAQYTKEDLANDNKKLEYRLKELQYADQLAGIYSETRQVQINDLRDTIYNNKLKESDAELEKISAEYSSRRSADKDKSLRQAIVEQYVRDKLLALEKRGDIIKEHSLQVEQDIQKAIESKYNTLNKYLDLESKLLDIQSSTISKLKESGSISQTQAIYAQAKLDTIKETSKATLDIWKLDQQIATLKENNPANPAIAGLEEQKKLLEANNIIAREKIRIEAEYQAALVKTEEILRSTEKSGKYDKAYFDAIQQDFANKVIETAHAAKSAASVLTQGLIDSLDSTIDKFFELMQQGKLTFTDIINTLRQGLSDAFRDAASQTLKNAWKDLFSNMGIKSSAEKAAEEAKISTDNLNSTISTKFPDLKLSIDSLTDTLRGYSLSGASNNPDEDPSFGKLKDSSKTLDSAAGKNSSASTEFFKGTVDFKTSIEKLMTGQMGIFDFATNSLQRIFNYLITGLGSVLSFSSGSSSGGGIFGDLLGTAVGFLTGNAVPGASPSNGNVTNWASDAFAKAWNAKGGVYESSDLSKYSNTVVTSPTMFAFAKGAGIMGEAGPEAIIPLKRDTQGNLGIRSNNTGDINIAISVNVETGQTTQQTTGNTQPNYDQFAKNMSNMVKEEIVKQKRPGGLLYA